MTATYTPAPGVHIGRPPCATCGANWHLHHETTWHQPKATQAHPVTGRGRDCTTCGRAVPATRTYACPAPYRPDSLATAIVALAAANDLQRVFAARGEVQRLMGHRPQGAAHCPACQALADTAP